MTEREKEHYAIAESFGVGRSFSRREYRDRYHAQYPDRPLGSMIPSDYCVNLCAKGTQAYPRFLRQLTRGMYEFLGGQRPA